jgi:chromosome segregation ATPase
MFYLKEISSLKATVADLNKNLGDASAKVAELTEAKASLELEIADFAEKLKAAELEHASAIDALKAEYEGKIAAANEAFETKVAEGVIELAADAGVQPVLQSPDAEENSDLGGQYAAITDPAERSKFLKKFGAEIIKKKL